MSGPSIFSISSWHRSCDSTDNVSSASTSGSSSSISRNGNTRSSCSSTVGNNKSSNSRIRGSLHRLDAGISAASNVHSCALEDISSRSFGTRHHGMVTLILASLALTLSLTLLHSQHSYSFSPLLPTLSQSSSPLHIVSSSRTAEPSASIHSKQTTQPQTSQQLRKKPRDTNSRELLQDGEALLRCSGTAGPCAKGPGNAGRDQSPASQLKGRLSKGRLTAENEGGKAALPSVSHKEGREGRRTAAPGHDGAVLQQGHVYRAKGGFFARLASSGVPRARPAPSVAQLRWNGSAQGSDYDSCSAVRLAPPSKQCELAGVLCQSLSGETLLDYMSLHYCTFRGNAWVSGPLYTLGLLLAFYLLADTAESFFCPTVTILSDMLHLAPNTAGVTLLALGNGAPDLSGAIASFTNGDPHIAMGAILSAGTFVTSFVVGAVALFVAPFPVEAAPFIRDAAMYAVAVVLVLWLYCSKEVHIWHAASMVGYYVVFVAVVVILDRRDWKKGHPQTVHPLSTADEEAPPLDSRPEGQGERRGGGGVNSTRPSGTDSNASSNSTPLQYHECNPGTSERRPPERQGSLRREGSSTLGSRSGRRPSLTRASSTLYESLLASSGADGADGQFHSGRQILGAASNTASMVRFAIHWIFDPLRWATIPSVEEPHPPNHSLYTLLNIALCPLLSLSSLASSLNLTFWEDTLPIPFPPSWGGSALSIPIWTIPYTAYLAVALLCWARSCRSAPDEPGTPARVPAGVPAEAGLPSGTQGGLPGGTPARGPAGGVRGTAAAQGVEAGQPKGCTEGTPEGTPQGATAKRVDRVTVQEGVRDGAKGGAPAPSASGRGIVTPQGKLPPRLVVPPRATATPGTPQRKVPPRLPLPPRGALTPQTLRAPPRIMTPQSIRTPPNLVPLTPHNIVTAHSIVTPQGEVISSDPEEPVTVPAGWVVFSSFVMSIIWIGACARELLGLLSSLGAILGASDAILGVTILAWGNSVGDLVTNITVALAGQPMMAVASCFAGPLFNLMLGLGIPLAIKTGWQYPVPWKFHSDPQLLMVFPFLLVGVLGSLIVVPYSGYKINRSWGHFLLGLYVSFIVVSLWVELFVIP